MTKAVPLKPIIAITGLVYGFLHWAKKHPEWIESHYSKIVYPLLFRGRKWFFQSLDTAVGDGLYLLFFLLFIVGCIRALHYNLRSVFLIVTLCLCLFFLWFELSWGVNYYRLPLEQKMAISAEERTADDLYSTTLFLAQQTNALHHLITSSADEQVAFPYSLEEFIGLLKYTASPSGVTTNAKASWYSTPLLYAGFSGYLNPFTLEAQVNAKIPPLQMPVTIAHEMAHQEGYAAENEASYIGFLRTFNHPDPYIRYASCMFALRHCFGALNRINADDAKYIRQTLSPGILTEFSNLYAFWEKYKNPLRTYTKKSYDKFLKANGQQQGIQSYSEVVRLLIHGYCQNLEIPFQFGNNL